MFDLGFGELLLLAVIALVVLGPERLPVAARLAGLWIRKARSQWNAVKAELENELADEELRRNLREASEAVRQGAQQVRDLRDDLSSGAAQMTRMAAPAASGDSMGPVADGDAAAAYPGDMPQTDPAQLSLPMPVQGSDAGPDPIPAAARASAAEDVRDPPPIPREPRADG